MKKKDLDVADDLIKYNLDLIQYSNGAVREIIVVLEEMTVEITAKLNEGVLTEFSRARLKRQLTEIDTILSRYYQDMANISADSVSGVATGASRVITGSLDEAMRGLVPVEVPAIALLERLETSAMVQGFAQRSWWDAQYTYTFARISDSVRRGVIAGDNNNKIIREVVREFDVSKRHAETLVRTSILSVSNDALFETYGANKNVVASVEWMAVLDSRTCLLCAPRDGLRWDFKKKPIGHKVEFAKPPRHFSCRCLLTPVTKTFRELGFDIDEPESLGRVSKEGKFGNIDFDEFLQRMEKRDKGFVDRQLGKKRAELWREGKITLLDLIQNNGKVKTLKELY